MCAQAAHTNSTHHGGINESLEFIESTTITKAIVIVVLSRAYRQQVCVYAWRVLSGPSKG